MARAIVTAAPAVQATARGAPSAAAPQTDSYSDIVMKLIPAEVVGVYLSMVAILRNSSDEVAGFVPWLVVVFGMAATYIYLRFTLKVTDIRQLLVTVGAFCVWAYAIGLPVEQQPAWHNGTYAGLLLIAYTFIAPKIPMGTKGSA
jgi:hypothetical protein